MHATFRLAVGLVTGVLLTSAIAIQAQQTQEAPPPRPMTADELELQRAMRTINSDKPALRAALSNPDNADVAKVKAEIATLKAAYKDAEKFFKDQKADDAVGWAGDALKLVARVETAASSAPPKWDEIRATSSEFSAICSRCHTARRERVSDGT